MADTNTRLERTQADRPGSERTTALSAWERVKLARHPLRPYTLDYARLCFSDFVEFHGDRLFADDAAIVAGLASLEGETVMLVGQQKGRDTKENVLRRFGMARPEGYRKALRLMRHAERFGFPVITLIDIPGADPSLQSEERGQALAIAENLQAMASLHTPIIALVIGEGGSGGALAIGMGDRVLMLENSVYSVASPEAAASILWRDAARAPEAAEAMRITPEHLLRFGVIDAVVPEPPGGAHVDLQATVQAVREALCQHLEELRSRFRTPQGWDVEALLSARYQKFRRIGVLLEDREPPA